MSSLFQYALLAAVGLITGFAAHGLSASVRGTIARHLIVRYLIEALAIVPGVALMGFVLGRRVNLPTSLTSCVSGARSSYPTSPLESGHTEPPSLTACDVRVRFHSPIGST